MLRQLLIGTVCVLAVAACNKTIDGLLTNSEPLTFNIKKKTTTVPAGKWAATLKFPSKKEVRLEITNPLEKKTTQVSFKVPKGAPLPQENGEFELDSTLSGQPYNVKGSINTEYVDSEEKWDWERCTYNVRRQECRYDQYGRPYCYWVDYSVDGQREVRFIEREATQEINFNLYSADLSRTAGTFNGTDISVERVYKYQGICR